MTKTCVDCSTDFVAPYHGHGTMVRCRPCQDAHKKVTQRRALQSIAGRFSVGSGMARSRGHEWRLSVDEYRAMIEPAPPCTYCGNTLNPSGSGLDRVDPTIGYVLGNVVPCCWPCNFIRSQGAFTYDEMMRLGGVLGPIWQVHSPMGPRQTRRLAPGYGEPDA